MSLSITTAIQRVDQHIKTRGLFPGAELDRAKAVLGELCNATVIVRSPVRGPDGRCVYVEVADNPIRLAAAVKIIEFETGKAPQTVDVTNNRPLNTAPTPKETMAMLKQNPEMASRIFEAFIAGAKRVQEAVVTEVSATSSPSKPESESGPDAR